MKYEDFTFNYNLISSNKNCILIKGTDNDSEQNDKSYLFVIPSHIYGVENTNKLAFVNIERHVIIDLDVISIKQITKAIPSLMQIPLYKLVYYWIKTRWYLFKTKQL